MSVCVLVDLDVVARRCRTSSSSSSPAAPTTASTRCASAGFHYDTKIMRKICDIWEEHGSGLIAFHGQTGNIMFQGATTENTQLAFDALNEIGFDLGGAGPCLRTAMSCVGAARCEMSNYDEQKALRNIINEYVDEIHRPAMPYKFKFKFSGCPNDRVDHVFAADFLYVGFNFVLVDLDVVAPGSDDGKIGALDGVDAVVGAAANT